MVNTKLNSYEQNKKPAEIVKNNFRTFGESKTEQEQFFRTSALHTGLILAFISFDYIMQSTAFFQI